MPINILMPALSPTMEEGTLAKWSVKEGDSVSSGDVIAEIETDKATMEFEAVDEGVIAKIMVAEGSEGVKVNELIAVLLEEGETEADLSASANVPPAAEPATAPAGAPSITPVPTPVVAIAEVGDRVFASPLARRIAAEKGLDLTQITGSGPKGRIVKADVETAVPGTSSSPTSSSASTAPKPVGSDTDTFRKMYADREYEEIELDGMRRTIASRLVEAKQTIPHFYLRRDIKIDGGLFTPVIRDADGKTMSRISSEMKDLAGRARDRKLAPHEYQGGSFAISNLGMMGIENFDAVINPPHASILAVGAGVKKPEPQRPFCKLEHFPKQQNQRQYGCNILR